MATRNLKLAVAEDLLNPLGIDATLIQYEALIKAEQSKPTPDLDRLESLFATRKNLRKLKGGDAHEVTT